MTTTKLDAIHPGEILAEEFMAPLKLSANALARKLAVPVTRITELIRGRRGVTADTALRLARFFRTSPDLWMSLQMEYDLRSARRKAGKDIDRKVMVLAEPFEPYRVRVASKSKGDRPVRSRSPVKP